MIFFPQGDVRRVGDHLHQVAIDQAHGFQCMGVGQRAVTGGHEGLDGMHQRIDAGTGGQERVHAQGGFRIDQRHVRHRRLADDGELHAFLLVGDDHELRHVSRRPRRRGNQDQRRAGHVQGIDAFELENVASVGNDNADAFAAIHRATTAHRDDDIAMVFPVQVGPEHHFLDPRIGRDRAVDAVIDTLGLEAGFDVRHPTGGDDPGVGDDQHFACAEGLGVVADIVPTTGTEHDFRRNELAQRAEAHLFSYVAHR